MLPADGIDDNTFDGRDSVGEDDDGPGSSTAAVPVFKADEVDGDGGDGKESEADGIDDEVSRSVANGESAPLGSGRFGSTPLLFQVRTCVSMSSRTACWLTSIFSMSTGDRPGVSFSGELLDFGAAVNISSAATAFAAFEVFIFVSATSPFVSILLLKSSPLPTVAVS